MTLKWRHLLARQQPTDALLSIPQQNAWTLTITTEFGIYLLKIDMFSARTLCYAHYLLGRLLGVPHHMGWDRLLRPYNIIFMRVV